MSRKTAEAIVLGLKERVDRVLTASYNDAHVHLSRMLDYIDGCSLLKEYVLSCQLEDPSMDVAKKLSEYTGNLGQDGISFGKTDENEIAFLYRAFLVLRNDLDAIRLIGFSFSHINDGNEMVAEFGRKFVMPFYNDIANHFGEYYKMRELTSGINDCVAFEMLDSLVKEVDELYDCVSYTAPKMEKWRFKAIQKLSAIYGSQSKEVEWMSGNAFPAKGAAFLDQQAELAGTLGMLQNTLSAMRDEFKPEQVPVGSLLTAPRFEYDVFVSHANDNKQSFVDSLSAGLNRLGIKVWYDSSILDWGDDWKAKIKEGLKKSRFGIVVLSPQFIGREWTTKELVELLNRQNERHEKVVLPLLYNLTVDDMKAKYPDLAPIQARPIREDEDAKDVVIDFARVLIHALKMDDK